MHRRQPTESDSLAVQISVADEQETEAEEGAVLAATQPLFAPLHRRTLTPLGGRNTRNAACDTEKDGDTCSSGYLPSSMNVLPSNATMTSASSSGSLDQSKALQLSAGSTCSGKSKFKSSKKQNKTKFALLSLQPLPRLGTDASKHSTRNISTEVLADESTTPSTETYTIKAERNAYYDSLTLSKNDVAYCASTSSSFFGGVLARDGGNNALEFRLPADGIEGGERTIFRSKNHNNISAGGERRRWSRRGVEHSSDFDIMHLSGPGCDDPSDDSCSIRQTGSFDALVSRDRSFRLGPLISRHRPGGSGESRAVASAIRSSRPFVSVEDTNSISNLTHRSGRTTGSVETIQHSNKAKRVGLRKVDDTCRVKPIGEGSGECADSDEDDDSDNEYSGSPSKRQIPKVLRKTGTKIKRALREVSGTNTKTRFTV